METKQSERHNISLGVKAGTRLPHSTQLHCDTPFVWWGGGTDFVLLVLDYA